MFNLKVALILKLISLFHVSLVYNVVSATFHRHHDHEILNTVLCENAENLDYKDLEVVKRWAKHCALKDLEKLTKLRCTGDNYGCSGENGTCFAPNTPPEFISKITKEGIQSFERDLYGPPPVAGFHRNREIALYVYKTWKDQGLENVEFKTYNALLSYPSSKTPSMVQICNKEKIYFTSKNHEGPIFNGTDGVLDGYLAYSPSGTVTGNPVYANNGTIEDFDRLKSKGINVKGCICIIRYGSNNLESKVLIAEKRGCSGVLVYVDPNQGAREGQDEANVYPNTFWIPGDAIHRGSTKRVMGDPRKPLGCSRPSTNYCPPFECGKNPYLPQILAYTIGYSDAKIILGNMAGDIVPANWTGLLNITYRYGPGFREEYANSKLKLTVSNIETIRSIYVVTGEFKGSKQRDRYVLFGNHRDSQTQGNLNPSTGTAAMLELTRALSVPYKKGWRPQKSLKFFSWDASDFENIGSAAWVESNLVQLYKKAVGYINLDYCLSGTAFYPIASASLSGVIRNATKLVQDPVQSRTLYEVWKEHSCNGQVPCGIPEVDLPPGALSDHLPFIFYAGIPVIRYFWLMDWKKYGISTYPAYETAYDTNYLLEKFYDGEYNYRYRCAQLGGILLNMLSEACILPYNFNDVAARMKSGLNILKENGMAQKLQDYHLSLDKLEKAVENFAQAAEAWHNCISAFCNNKEAVHEINNRMMVVQREFVGSSGYVPYRPDRRYLIYGTINSDNYVPVVFPCIHELLTDLNGFKPSGTAQYQIPLFLDRCISETSFAIFKAAALLECPNI